MSIVAFASAEFDGRMRNYTSHQLLGMVLAGILLSARLVEMHSLPIDAFPEGGLTDEFPYL